MSSMLFVCIDVSRWRTYLNYPSEEIIKKEGKLYTASDFLLYAFHATNLTGQYKEARQNLHMQIEAG
jgi:hypothetical protein